MSKSKKIAILTAVCCLLGGLALAFVSIWMLGFDFGKLNNDVYVSKEQTVTETFEHIDIKQIDQDIRIVPATQGECKLSWRENEKLPVSIKVEEGTLCITQTDERRWWDNIGIHFDDSENAELTLYLPEGEYEKLLLKSVSGDIFVSKELSFSQATVHTTSGDVSLAAQISAGLSMKTTSGDVRAEGVLGGAVLLESTSGDISLSNSTADTLTINTTSGDMELDTLTVQGSVQLDANSGDIEFKHLQAGEINIEVTSGDVEGTLIGSYLFSAQSTSGNVRVPESDPGAAPCNIKTTSGDIDVSPVQ